ncbi:MAG: histidine kinase [Gorillibacterium sp.]|nr:histidine kinase [Gorillibacterium sp.]
MIKYKTFRNLLIMLVLLLAPATLLFSYANRVSENVVQETLEHSASKQLEFSMLQLELSLRQLETQATLFINDSTVKAYGSSSEFSEYINHLLLRRNVEENLVLYSQADPLAHDLSVYWPSLNETLSSNSQKKLTVSQLETMPRNRWFMQDQDGELTFHFLLSNPAITSPNLQHAVAVVETTIASKYLLSVLQGLDSSGNGKSFFYFQGAVPLADHTVDSRLISLIEHKKLLTEASTTHPELFTVSLDKVKYLVQMVSSPSLGGTLVSYIKLNRFLNPLKEVNLLVNGSLLFLFVAGIALSVLLYRNFRIPLGYLVRKIDQLGSGNYQSRAVVQGNNEFDYLFEKFNDMELRIQTLIENVYEEKVRTQEAEYKHLQSQINPHFLYNCLFYIVSMAHKSPEAVVSMAKNLAQYYRYITRKVGANKNSLLVDEIHLIESYLEVQALRNKHLHYEIAVPDSMFDLQVPTLLLQPIVENAFIHGLDQKRDSGRIRIVGSTFNNRHTLIIEDDGKGMTEEARRTLAGQILESQSTDEIGCGLWNINQRLINRFGSDAGLSFSSSEWGGLQVTMVWTSKEEEWNDEYPSGR